MGNKVLEEKILKIDKSKWKLTKLGTLAEDISVRVDKPGNSEYDRFVGLDNFISGDIKIKDSTAVNNCGGNNQLKQKAADAAKAAADAAAKAAADAKEKERLRLLAEENERVRLAAEAAERAAGGQRTAKSGNDLR